MLTQGFGESSPIADNDSDEGRERNRRVELKVTEASDVGADTGTNTGTGTGDTSSANDSSLSEPANGGEAPELSEVGNSAAQAERTEARRVGQGRGRRERKGGGREQYKKK